MKNQPKGPRTPSTATRSCSPSRRRPRCLIALRPPSLTGSAPARFRDRAGWVGKAGSCDRTF